MSDKHRLHFGYIIMLACCSGLVLTLSGCIGPLYGFFIDPWVPKPKIRAEHDMHDKTVLIWVDIVTQSVSNPTLRRHITLELQNNLLKHKAAAAIIPYEQIAAFRRQNPQLSDFSIQQLGQKLHAQEVLYVLVEEFHLQAEAGRDLYKASIRGYYKVIDVQTGERLWPDDNLHRFFQVEHRMTSGKGATFENEQVQSIAVSLAKQIALNFYEHRSAG